MARSGLLGSRWWVSWAGAYALVPSSIRNTFAVRDHILGRQSIVDGGCDLWGAIFSVE
jgi:hypothetical protein